MEELADVGSIRKNKIDLKLGVELVEKCLKVGLKITIGVGTQVWHLPKNKLFANCGIGGIGRIYLFNFAAEQLFKKACRVVVLDKIFS